MPAALHRELVGDAAASCLLLAHGIYGSGANWRSIARKLVERRPDWSVALVDLRNHGRSRGAPPPHDLAACADDVLAVIDATPAVRAIGGHSFGGKVMLAARRLAPPRLVQTWLFDASPSPRPGAAADPANSVARVLALMERLPRRWARREDFVAALVAEGQAPLLAQWLAMNVVPVADGGHELRLDLAAIREMLADYYVRDLWPIALDPTLPGSLEVVVATRSPVFEPADRERLAAAPAHVHVHAIDAGHWLHIDAAPGVVDLLAATLPSAPR